MFIMSFAMFLGAKIKRIIYIASDLSKNFSLFNNKSRAIITQKSATAIILSIIN